VRSFTYVRAPELAIAIEAGLRPESAFLGGGTTLVDVMRIGVVAPAQVVDLGGLPLAEIAVLPDGGVRLGALASNADAAAHPAILARFPVIAEALLAGASPQVRNMATTGGNLLQKTRCPYYRDLASPCNKRQPGAGCAAIDGYNRSHALLGGSAQCIATHPSDLCVALAALDATVRLNGPRGERAVAFEDFHTLPGDHPELESVLEPGEVIVAVDLPARPFTVHSRYVKARDRASFAFALASAAVALDLGAGRIREARIALGGVATKPWRARDAERLLAGEAPSSDVFQRAATAALQGAKPRTHNAFKVELAQHVIVRALERAAGVS
jgi:xanthine dehydrogenase YagS FAD-binding subunit